LGYGHAAGDIVARNGDIVAIYRIVCVGGMGRVARREVVGAMGCSGEGEDLVYGEIDGEDCVSCLSVWVLYVLEYSQQLASNMGPFPSTWRQLRIESHKLGLCLVLPCFVDRLTIKNRIFGHK